MKTLIGKSFVFNYVHHKKDSLEYSRYPEMYYMTQIIIPCDNKSQ